MGCPELSGTSRKRVITHMFEHFRKSNKKTIQKETKASHDKINNYKTLILFNYNDHPFRKKSKIFHKNKKKNIAFNKFMQNRDKIVQKKNFQKQNTANYKLCLNKKFYDIFIIHPLNYKTSIFLDYKTKSLCSTKMSLKFTIDPNSKLMKTAAILANFTNLPYSPSKNQKRKNINSTEEVEFANNNPKNCKNDLNEIYSSLENLMEDDGNISEPTVLTKDVVKYREILGPICIRLSTEEREYFKNSPTEFAELARSKLQAKYKMIRPDANGDILIFPNTYEDVEAIMNSKSFYPNNIRKNLDKERNSIIITNEITSQTHYAK